mgnify:CR=1 FL=1
MGPAQSAIKGGDVAVYDSFAVKSPCGGGLTRRLRRGRWGCRPEGGSTFFRSESAKESTRHGGYEGGPRRYALRPSPALRLGLATRFMAFSHFWR